MEELEVDRVCMEVCEDAPGGGRAEDGREAGGRGAASTSGPSPPLVSPPLVSPPLTAALSSLLLLRRFSVAPRLHPDWMLMLCFAHTHLTVTVTLCLLLVPKVTTLPPAMSSI